MIDTKQKAKYILEEYANCYSEVDVKQLAECLNEIKAEAYKEFARLLRQQAFDRLYVSIDEINNLLKELVGDK